MQVRDAKAEGGGDVAPIPVTVRQLEALVRISESLARMELNTAVGARHVQAAIDLFGASTLDAVRSGMAQSLVLSEEQVCTTPPFMLDPWQTLHADFTCAAAYPQRGRRRCLWRLH